MARSGSPHDGAMEALRGWVADLQILTERADEIARAQSVLAAFRFSYRQDVRLPHEELDELKRAIAKAELGARRNIRPAAAGGRRSVAEEIG